MDVKGINHIDSFDRNEIRASLLNLNEAPSEDIEFHVLVPNEVIKEVFKLTKIINEYLEKKYPFKKIDYNFNSKGNCHILSCLFVLADPSWKLVQGEYNFDDETKHYYHSWIQKDEWIYDPALNIITLSGLYNRHFKEKNIYTKKQVVNLLQKNSTFTYFEFAKENASMLMKLYELLNDEKKRKERVSRDLNEFNEFISERQNVKTLKLLPGNYQNKRKKSS